MPHRRIWSILLSDPVALTEVLSGFFLVALRGTLLLGPPRIFTVTSEVAEQLHAIGVTEDRWGTYLMICGVCQIFLARTRYTLRRTLVSFAILAGFVVMGAGFYQVSGWSSVPVSLICMSSMYVFLMIRMGVDHLRIRRKLRARARS